MTLTFKIRVHDDELLTDAIPFACSAYMQDFEHTFINKILKTDQTGENYLYVIHWTAGKTVYPHERHKKLFVLPPDVKQMMQQKKAVLLIDYTCESLVDHIEHRGTIMDDLLRTRFFDILTLRRIATQNNIPRSQMIVVTGNLALPAQKEFIVRRHCMWEHSVSDMDQQRCNRVVADIANRKIRPHHFMCLQRRPNGSRATFAYEVWQQGLRDKGVTTLWEYGVPEWEQLINTVRPEADKANIAEFIKTIPWMWDVPEGEEIVNPNPIELGDQEWLHQNSYVNFIQETLVQPHPNHLFFSEKAFKSIVSLQPFVLFGSVGSLEWMQEAGYTTFSDWWDESYDLNEDYEKRWLQAFSVLEWVTSKSPSYLSGMLVDQLHVLQENRRIHMERSERIIKYTRWYGLHTQLAHLG